MAPDELSRFLLYRLLLYSLLSLQLLKETWSTSMASPVISTTADPMTTKMNTYSSVRTTTAKTHSASAWILDDISTVLPNPSTPSINSQSSVLNSRTPTPAFSTTTLLNSVSSSVAAVSETSLLNSILPTATLDSLEISKTADSFQPLTVSPVLSGSSGVWSRSHSGTETSQLETLMSSSHSSAGDLHFQSVIETSPIMGSITLSSHRIAQSLSSPDLPANSKLISSGLASETVISTNIDSSAEFLSAVSEITLTSVFVSLESSQLFSYPVVNTVVPSAGIFENWTAVSPAYTSTPPSGNGLLISIPAIIGICSGAIAFIVVMIAIILGFSYKRKTKQMSPSKNGYSSYYNAMWEDGVTLSYINNHIELPKDNPEEMISLDDDTFLQSLDVAGFNDYWADKKNTKL